MEKQTYLSNLNQFEGMSLRAIAKKTGHHFNTVKKYVDCEDWNKEYKPRKERISKLEPLYEIIDTWIKEDLKRSRKYRRTATKIYNDLFKNNEYQTLLDVGRQTVINYVSKRKKELCKKAYDTAMFGLHSIAEAQVDFGNVLIMNHKGIEETWSELVLSFPWSNAGFTQVCRYQTKECLCEALIHIFEYIGGVPLRILFDNMSSAVIQIEENGQRKLTEMFMRFTMHHRFKADFCNPESPNEKGNVENKVGYLRRNLLLPPPKIEDLDEFNRNLLQECMLDLEREHYVKKEQMSELFQSEKETFIPLPREKFRVFELIKAKTDKYSFVRFDKNQYSTAPEYNECELWVEAGSTEIRILNSNFEQVATHKRKYEKDMMPSIDFENYVSALSRKPRAFKNSPYFETLPENIKNYLKNCSYKDLKRILLSLTPIIKEGKIADADCIFELYEIRTAFDFDSAYKALTENTSSPEIVAAPNLPEQEPYLPKLNAYAALMEEVTTI